jgi:alpha-L-fucosidase
MRAFDVDGLTRRSLLQGAAAAAGAAALPGALAAPARAASGPYEPTWESIDSHPLPRWFDDAKIGIFIHWGIFSVPAWAPRGKYAEWYPNDMRIAGGPTYEYHRSTYGPDFAYRDFIPMFRAERWDPDHWAQLFRDAGARYVVPVGEHHDGFPLWNTATTRWNSARMGPRRDIVRELGAATRSLRMRYAPSYHQLLNYYAPEYDAPHPLYLSDGYVERWMLPQLHELVEKHEADMLWLDGDWMATAETFRTKELTAWYYNRAHRRGREVLVNDRLGQVRSQHGDFYTAEYDYNSDQGIEHKWENTRGCGASFGFNRNEPPEDYMTAPELLELLVKSVAYWGNLLLNVGPAADGTINDIQRELLRAMGRWLETNGDGIYGTRFWREQESETREGHTLYYTAKESDVYAFVVGRPGPRVTLPAADLPELRRGSRVRLLGSQRPLRYERNGPDLAVELPSKLHEQPIHTLHFGRRRVY